VRHRVNLGDSIMPEAPKPSSWPSKFLGWSTSIAIGAVLLYLAVQVLRSIAVVIAAAVGALFVLWLLVQLRRAWRSREW
jgi:hypothetical protein